MISALAADLFGECITQSNSAIEHRLLRCRVRIAHKVALALELHHFTGLSRHSQRRLDPRAAQNLNGMRIEVGGKVLAAGRIGLVEQRIVKANFGIY